jgi:hypothetical protein
MHRTPVMMACLVALAGCGGDAPSDARPATVTDSAGIRIVEHAGDLPADSIPLRIVWRHGDDEGEYAFQRAFPGALGPDGVAFVGDVSNAEIIRIDGEGRGAYSILARRGQGPAEVMGPRGLMAAADGSVFVDDRPNRKILRFVGDSLADILTAEGSTLLDMRPVGVAADGALLMTTASFNSRFEVPWLDGYVARIDFDPFALDTVVAYPMAERNDQESPTAFGYQGWMSGSHAGLVQIRTDRPEVLWRNGRGELVTIARWDPEPAYVDDAMIEAFKERLRADLIRVNPQMPRADAEVFAAERAASYQFDPTRPLPVMRLAFLGQDGRAWVEEFAADGEPLRLRVLNPDGTAQGTVHLPFPIRFLDATSEHLLGIATGDLGVQSIVLFAVGSPGS